MEPPSRWGSCKPGGLWCSEEGVRTPSWGVRLGDSVRGAASQPCVAPALGPQWLRGEESACNAGDSGLGLGYSLEEGMTPDSSVFAWRSPWSGEPGGLQSVGSQRVLPTATEATPEQLQSSRRRRERRRRERRRGSAHSAHARGAQPASWVRPCPAHRLHTHFAPCLCPEPPSTMALGGARLGLPGGHALGRGGSWAEGLRGAEGQGRPPGPHPPPGPAGAPRSPCEPQFPMAEHQDAPSRWNNGACVSWAKYRAAAAMLAAKTPRSLGGWASRL